MDQKVNTRSKSIKILEESIGINFDLGFYKFIDISTKVGVRKYRHQGLHQKWDFSASRGIIQKVKIAPTDLRELFANHIW